MSVKERIQFDYGYSGWIITNGFHKQIRYNFVNKITFVRSFNNAMYAIFITKILVKKRAAISFYRVFFVYILTEKNWNILKK